MISAILLAAGASRRMGAPNKLLLPFRNTTLLGNVVTALCASEAEEVIGLSDEPLRPRLPAAAVVWLWLAWKEQRCIDIEI